jgi:hypothetical protein
MMAPEPAEVRCLSVFVKIAIGFFTLDETAKSRDGFIRCLNYNLAATVSGRI